MTGRLPLIMGLPSDISAMPMRTRRSKTRGKALKRGSRMENMKIKRRENKKNSDKGNNNGRKRALRPAKRKSPFKGNDCFVYS